MEINNDDMGKILMYAHAYAKNIANFIFAERISNLAIEFDDEYSDLKEKGAKALWIKE